MELKVKHTYIRLRLKLDHLYPKHCLGIEKSSLVSFAIIQ